MRRSVISLLLAATVLLLGCGSSGDGDDGNGQQLVGKGDCPDCDPAGPSAFEQANMGLRFYMAKDQWKVAYQFKERSDMVHEALRSSDLPEDPTELLQVEEDKFVHISSPFLFQYDVLAVDKRKIDNVMRDVATIKVTQAAEPDPQLFSTDRLDRHEYALQFELDDLLRPVKETFFNRAYPHGKSIAVDQDSSLSGIEGGSNLFPHTVPRVLTNAVSAGAPAMTAELEAAADAEVPGWRAAQYNKYIFPNGDQVYWATGQLWPFFVDSQQGYSLLVEQQLVQR